MIEEAASDDRVLAIKQVLYRTSRQSPIVAALKKAAQNGKYVSVVVELKARFDEARNIEWAREMERTGVQVIYGIRGLKTHAKVCIIVRKESHGITRYMHFGTGNYNEATSQPLWGHFVTHLQRRTRIRSNIFLQCHCGCKSTYPPSADCCCT